MKKRKQALPGPGESINHGRAPRQRVALGPPRPAYLQSADNDRLFMIITALAAEVSALRDRLDTHEALAESGLAATSGAVDSFALTVTRQAGRERAREAMLARVFRVLLEELNSVREGTTVELNDVLQQESRAE